MNQRLVIIRGNSGSGKSTIAKSLQASMGDKTMLIPQDVVRREFLKSQDQDHEVTARLIYDIAMYGKGIGYDVIIEGILTKKRYKDMLHKLINDFGDSIYVYYFDISFEETLRRHNLKSAANEFGEEEMKQWWSKSDYLDCKNEMLITDDMTKDIILKTIIKDIN